jgi:hypothetical protein
MTHLVEDIECLVLLYLRVEDAAVGAMDLVALLAPPPVQLRLPVKGNDLSKSWRTMQEHGHCMVLWVLPVLNQCGVLELNP